MRTRTVLLALLAAGLALRLVGIAQSDPLSRQNQPFTDDSFYYFSLGESIASGQGPRVEEQPPTNAFQPLWGGICALAFKIAGGDRHRAIALIQVVGAVSGLLTALLLFSMGRRMTGAGPPGLVLAGAWLLYPRAIQLDLNGMETGLAVTGVLFLLWAALVLRDRTFEEGAPGAPSMSSLALLGLAGGVAVMARVDILILAISLTLVWAGSGTLMGLKESGPEGGRASLRCVGALWSGILLLSLPWVVFSLSLGKGPFPSSGEAVRNLGLLFAGLPPHSLAEGITRHLLPVLELGVRGTAWFTATWAEQSPLLEPLSSPVSLLELDRGTSVPTALVGLVTMGLALRLMLRREDGPRWFVVSVLCLYGLGMTVAYSFITLSSWFFSRYSAPLGILHSMVMVVGAWSLLRPRKALAGGYLAICLGLFGAQVVQGPQRWLLQGPQEDGDLRAIVAWMHEERPPQEKVGAFQSGFVGFWSEGRVVNLDGKVNAEARTALEEDRLWEYVCKEKLTYLLDWEELFRLLLYRGERTPLWEARLEPVFREEPTEQSPERPIQVYKVNHSTCAP